MDDKATASEALRARSSDKDDKGKDGKVYPERSATASLRLGRLRSSEDATPTHDKEGKPDKQPPLGGGIHSLEGGIQ